MGRILVVEDDADCRGLVESAIALDGHMAIGAETAEQADAILDECVPDLALVDIKLPKENGVSLAWRLRRRLPSMPIIIVSAVLEEWERDDILDCGVDSVFAKPYEMNRLRRTINQFLRRGRPSRRARY